MFYRVHRRHSLRDLPGPKFAASDHRPTRAGGRVAIPPAGRVPDSQLQRGQAPLFSDWPTCLNLKHPAHVAGHTIRKTRIDLIPNMPAITILAIPNRRSREDYTLEQNIQSAPQVDTKPPNMASLSPLLPQCTTPLRVLTLACSWACLHLSFYWKKDFAVVRKKSTAETELYLLCAKTDDLWSTTIWRLYVYIIYVLWLQYVPFWTYVFISGF